MLGETLKWTLGVLMLSGLCLSPLDARLILNAWKDLQNEWSTF